MTKAYSFLKDKKTDETHIFEGDFTTLNRCNADDKSICKKDVKKDGDWINTCLNEDQARKKAAELGRSVCGICVSHLYTTYNL